MRNAERLALRALELGRELIGRVWYVDDDVVGDVVEKFLRRGRQNRPVPEKVDAFIMRAFKHQSIDAHRKSAALPFLPWCDETVSVADDSGKAPEAIEEVRQQMRLVLIKLGQIDEQMRQVFWLSKHDGMTYREIGVQMGLTEKKVKSELAKAIYTLQQRIDLGR